MRHPDSFQSAAYLTLYASNMYNGPALRPQYQEIMEQILAKDESSCQERAWF